MQPDLRLRSLTVVVLFFHIIYEATLNQIDLNKKNFFTQNQRNKIMPKIKKK